MLRRHLGVGNMTPWKVHEQNKITDVNLDLLLNCSLNFRGLLPFYLIARRLIAKRSAVKPRSGAWRARSARLGRRGTRRHVVHNRTWSEASDFCLAAPVWVLIESTNEAIKRYHRVSFPVLGCLLHLSMMDSSAVNHRDHPHGHKTCSRQ